MPKPRTQLPAQLSARAFTVAEAKSLGVSENVLSHRRFVRKFHGLRIPENLCHEVGAEEAFALLLRIGEAFSHTTALTLFGCPIQCGYGIHITISNHRRARRTAGIIGHSTRRSVGTLTLPNGICVVPPELAIVQAAGELPLREIIVAIDHLLLTGTQGAGAGRPPDEEMLWEMVKNSRAEYARKIRKALRYRRLGSESRMETLLRLLLEAFGLASYFETQVNIFDDEGWIGRFDLVCLRLKLIVEYDGEQHRTDRKQYLKDERRLDRVKAEGYTVIRLRAEDVVGRNWRRTAQRVATELGLEGAPTVVDAELLS